MKLILGIPDGERLLATVREDRSASPSPNSDLGIPCRRAAHRLLPCLGLGMSVGFRQIGVRKRTGQKPEEFRAPEAYESRG